MRQFVASTSPLKELRAFELLKIALFKFPPPGACVQVLHPRARFDGPFFTKGEISDGDFLLIN